MSYTIYPSGSTHTNPRRPLKHLLANPPPGFFPVYVITESPDSVNEFYRKLLLHLIGEDFIGTVIRHSKRMGLRLKTLRIEEIGETVKFGAPAEVDFASEFERFLQDLDLDGTILLMIDEFPQALENIIDNEGEDEANRLLRTQRECRQNPILQSKIQFIYAGSIGLENVVARINASKHINDLDAVHIPPLSRHQAKVFLRQELRYSGIEMPAEIQTHLLDLLDWLIPFYIRGVVEELPKVSNTEQQIERAINGLLEQQQYFEHWLQRLRISLPHQQFLFAKAVLNACSNPEAPRITSAEITNLTVEHQVSNSHNDIMAVLKHDGYLNNQDDPRVYRFSSPIVRMWWWRNVAN